MVLFAMALTTVRADEPSDKQTRATALATCAAYYFNAVNVKPVTQYEAIYSLGERAFNAAIKLVGRQRADELLAHSSGEMMSLMASNWQNFPSVVKRYGAACESLMLGLPHE